MSEPLGFVHQFIEGGSDSAPVLLLLHGTGGNENDLLDLGHALLLGAPLLSPRGKVLEHGMPRFFRRLAEGVFDEADLIQRTHELADFLREAASKYRFGNRKVVAVGYSNGANIATSTLLLRPDALDGAVLLRAMVPLIPAKLPDLGERPVLLASGLQDPLVPKENVERLSSLLRKAGAHVSLKWSPTGHQIDSSDFANAQLWLRDNFG